MKTKLMSPIDCDLVEIAPDSALEQKKGERGGGELEKDRKSLRLEPCPDWVERAKVPNTSRKAGEPFTCLLKDNRMHVPQRALYCRNVIRLEGAQAVQQLSRVEISFDPEIQTLVIHGISIFRHGILTNHAKLEDIEILRRETQLEAGIVNGEVSALQLLKDVRIGDVLDVEFSLINHGGLFADAPSWVQNFGGRFPVGLWQFSWIDLSENSVEILNKAEGFDCRETSKEGLLERTWSACNTPTLEPELFVPHEVFQLPFIQVSPFAHWEPIVRRFIETWNFSVADRAELDKELAAIRTAAGDDAGRKIELAVCAARDAVRYQNYSPGLLAIVPEDISKVWDRRFGDCKEKTMLLVWLLREMGFAADPVLVASVTGKALPDLLPAPNLFDHVVTRIKLEDKILWIDPTDSYRGSPMLSWEGLSFHYGLPLADGPAGLVEIPPLPPSALRVEETIEGKRGSQETRHKVRFSFYGKRADHMRGMLDAQGLAAMSRALKGFMDMTRKGIEIEGDLDINDDRNSNEMEIRLEAVCAEGIRSDKLNIAPFVFVDMLPILESAKRTHPVSLGALDLVEHTVKVRHPDVTKADYPLHTTSNPAFYAKVNSEMQGNIPTFRFFLEIKKSRVELEDVATLRSDVRKTLGFVDVLYHLPESAEKAKLRSAAPQLGEPGQPGFQWTFNPRKLKSAKYPSSGRIPYWPIGVGLFAVITILRLCIESTPRNSFPSHQLDSYNSTPLIFESPGKSSDVPDQIDPQIIKALQKLRERNDWEKSSEDGQGDPIRENGRFESLIDSNEHR